MNFDMNVFMNALQAGFGAGNTAKTQAPAEQKEELLFEDFKPVENNQIQQQPQIAQDQQNMGFFAMMGMMFLGVLSLFGFGNNANNNANNNVNNNANNNVNNNANNKVINDEQKTDEQKALDKLFADAKQVVYLEKMAVKNTAFVAQPVTTNVDKKINEIKEANYNKQCEAFKASNPDVAEILTLEDAKEYADKLGHDIYVHLEFGVLDFVERTDTVNVKSDDKYDKIYYIDKEGNVKADYADPKARELCDAANKAYKEFADYDEREYKKNPKITYDEHMKNNPEYKRLSDRARAAKQAFNNYLSENGIQK